MFWIRIRQNKFSVYGACCFMGQVPLQKVSENRTVLYQSPSPPHVCPVVRGRESRRHGDSCHARTARAGVGAASVEEEQRAAQRGQTPWPWPPSPEPRVLPPALQDLSQGSRQLLGIPRRPAPSRHQQTPVTGWRSVCICKYYHSIWVTSKIS